MDHESPTSSQSVKRVWDDALGMLGVGPNELPPLPDDMLTNPGSGRIDPRGWFAQPDLPLHLEIGTGKGTFLVEQAPRAPEVNFLGVEWEREFYLYTADRLRRRALTNVRMLHANAVDFLHWRVPDASISVIHLYYSDPWPKHKHHKNRVVQHRFLADVWRTLAPGGELRVVTDHDELWAWCAAHFRLWTRDPIPDDRTAAVEVPEPGGEQATRLLRWFAEQCGDDGATCAPFAASAFVPPDWVQAGGIVGTNYERKFTSETHRPHSIVLRKLELARS